jgi:hypothetical protein
MIRVGCTFLHETTSEQETCDLDHLVICRCKKQCQLVHQEWGFVACFPLDILMVHLPQPGVASDGSNLFGSELDRNEIIPFRN